MRKDATEHRQRLLAAAQVVFARDGAKAPLEAVLEEAGLGRGTLYRHFQGRVDLMLAIMREELNELINFVDVYPNDTQVMQACIERQAKGAALHCRAALAATRGKAKSTFMELQEDAEKYYEKLISRSRASGVIGVDVDANIIRAAVTMYAAVTSPNFNNLVNIDDRTMMNIIMHGLSAPSINNRG